MPIYEYECLSCGERFDAMRKLSDPPLTECRLCKGKVRKLLGTPALQFKGSGWYITDYAGKSSKPGTAEPGKEKSNGSDGSGEPVRAAKPDKKETPSCACASKGCGASKQD